MEDPTLTEEDSGCTRHSQLQLGSYSAAGFRARLAKSEFPPGNDGFAVFVHEYWHHLHNVTTLTGVERFRAIQLLLSLFSKTLDPNSGESCGSQVLSAEETLQFNEFRDVLRELEGDKGPTGRADRSDLEAKVVEVKGAYVTVEILKQRAVVGTETFLLGAKAIEESVAFLVERMVNEAANLSVYQAAEFPYGVLTRLAEFVSGTPPSNAILVGLGTLALASNDPGGQVVTLLRAYETHRPHFSDLGALRAVVEKMRLLLRNAISYAKPILDDVRAMHHERGMSEKAVIARCDAFLRALERRSFGPIFDVEGFLERPTADSINTHIARLMEDYPPPTFTLVAEEDIDGEKLETLVAFGDSSDDADGFQLPQYERVFEAQARFMLAHLSAKGFKPSAEVKAACPFISTCTHSLRTSDLSSCERRPWHHIAELGTEGSHCWYTSGVLGLLGKVKFSRVYKVE